MLIYRSASSTSLSPTNIDLTTWKYADLRDVINTSCGEKGLMMVMMMKRYGLPAHRCKGIAFEPLLTSGQCTLRRVGH